MCFLCLRGWKDQCVLQSLLRATGNKCVGKSASGRDKQIPACHQLLTAQQKQDVRQWVCGKSGTLRAVLMRACFEGEPPLCIGCFCSVSGDQSEHSISGGFLSPLGALPWIWGVLCPCWRGRGRRLPYTEGRRCCLSASAQCCACFLGTGLSACCRNWTPVLHDCTWP